jgi:hypothetical protein
MLCFDRVQTALGIRLHVWAAILFKGNKVKRLHTYTLSREVPGDPATIRLPNEFSEGAKAGR